MGVGLGDVATRPTPPAPVLPGIRVARVNVSIVKYHLFRPSLRVQFSGLPGVAPVDTGQDVSQLILWFELLHGVT